MLVNVLRSVFSLYPSHQKQLPLVFSSGALNVSSFPGWHVPIFEISAAHSGVTGAPT